MKVEYIISSLLILSFIPNRNDNSSEVDKRIVVLDENISIELNWIPPGSFYLGSTPAERNWAVTNGGCTENNVKIEGSNKRPAKIKDGFWMGQYEVTNNQFKRFVEETDFDCEAKKFGSIYSFDWESKKWKGINGKTWKDIKFGLPNVDDYPVVSVSWNDAMAFCNWLTKKEIRNIPKGYVFRLPTEAEWEYACNGGGNSKFWWGNAISDYQGRMNGAGPDSINTKLKEYYTGFLVKDGFPFTSPVGYFGLKGQNLFGLSDMLGNAQEWVLDKFNEYGATESICTDGTNKRILKGGCYCSPAGFCRAAFRYPWDGNTCCAQVGFRIALAKKIEGYK